METLNIQRHAKKTADYPVVYKKKHGTCSQKIIEQKEHMNTDEN